jgi:hypothetical protein
VTVAGDTEELLRDGASVWEVHRVIHPVSGSEIAFAEVLNQKSAFLDQVVQLRK